MGLVYNNAAQAGTIGTQDSVGVWNGGYNNWYISNWPLAAMVEGDDKAQRVGRKIRLKNIDFNFFWVLLFLFCSFPQSYQIIHTLLPETLGSRATRSSFFGIFPIAEDSRETNFCTWKCHVEGYCSDHTKTHTCNDWTHTCKNVSCACASM